LTSIILKYKILIIFLNCGILNVFQTMNERYKMKLQLAMDFINRDNASKLIKDLKEIIDIFEFGTPFVIQDGIGIISGIKKIYPEITALADLKIMDAGEHEARMAFNAGAEIVTVLGAADNSTIKGTVKEAKAQNKKVMADMIAVLDIQKRAIEIDSLGVDYICVHTAFDIQLTGKNPLEELIIVSKIVKKAKIAVAGGVNLETLRKIIPLNPEIVVVGGYITGSENKVKTAFEMKELIIKSGGEK
jgi:3-hexulose-6-phosphate synthase